MILPSSNNNNRRKHHGDFRLFNYSGKYPGYTSTTLFEKITRLFQQDTDKGVVFEIHLPKGFKCLYIRPLSKFRYQEEVLLPRNSIISIKKFKGNNHIIAEVHMDKESRVTNSSKIISSSSYSNSDSDSDSDTDTL